MIRLDIKDIEISEEQARQFAIELYYGSDLIADIKKTIADNREDYERFLKRKGAIGKADVKKIKQ